jgi:hypothetical protein
MYTNEDIRTQILSIINAVWDDGLFITFGLLPGIIAVIS